MMATPAKTVTARTPLAVDNPTVGVARPQADTSTASALSLDAYLCETLPLDLSELAQDVVAQMLTEGRLENVDIHYHLPEESVRVDLPRRQFARIIEHMVATAAEAMKALVNRPHVLRVIVEPPDAFGDYGPRLKVQDTGASVIVEDSLQATIERAETLGARLTVKNRPMGGNIFSVELPAEQMKSW